MFSLLLLGCNANTDANPPSEAPAETAAVADAPPPDAPAKPKQQRGDRGRFGKGGPQLLIHAALDTLELSDEQRTTIEGLKGELSPSDSEASAHQDLDKALADGVRAGALDDAVIQGKVDALKKEVGAKHAATMGVLGKLHQALTAAQRKALVDGLRTRSDERGAWMQSDDDASDDVAGADDVNERRPPRERAARGPLGMLGPWLRDLELSDEQKSKVGEALAGQEGEPERARQGRDEMMARMKAMTDAFESEQFDASQLSAGGVDKVTEMVDKKTKLLAAILPILDAAQRDKLADNLEQGKRGKHGKPGRRGMRGAR